MLASFATQTGIHAGADAHNVCAHFLTGPIRLAREAPQLQCTESLMSMPGHRAGSLLVISKAAATVMMLLSVWSRLMY